MSVGAKMRRASSGRVVGGGLGYPDEVLADSPISYWRFEETSGTTAADEQGNRNATVYGVDLSAAGQVGSGALFNAVGTLDRMTAGNAPASMAALTLEAFIRTTDRQDQQIICTDSDLATDQRGWQWRTNATTGILNLTKISNGVVECVGVSDVADGFWHHVVGTYDGTNLRVYVDGALEGTAAASGAITGTTAPNLAIGWSTRSGGNGYWQGDIDEPAVYDHALSAARILAHFDASGL